MAKAIFGHLGVPSDQRLVAEVTRLRRRVSDLEDELSRLRAANEELARAVDVHSDVLSLRVPDSLKDTEPALT
jgi:ABC-type phosphate transport system auxiliary subunit